MRKIILFFVRIKLGVKKWEKFRFENQKSKVDYYYFDNKKLVKAHFNRKMPNCRPVKVPSNVSLNWLIGKECKIIKLRKEDI